MLQALREKTTGWVATVIVGILIVPFAFFGVEQYFSPNVATYVAKVGEDEISPDEFRTRFEEYRGQMRQMLGERYDARMFDTPEIKRQMLDRLIEERLLLQAGEAGGVIVPPARLQREISSIDAFKVNGQFDADQYRMLLGAQNMSPRGFEDRVRRDLAVQLLPQQLSASAFATPAEIDEFVRLRDQRRSFRSLALPPVDASTLPQPTDAEVQAYYEANTAQYMSEEKVALEYVELSAGQLEAPSAPDESTLQQRYEEQKARFVEPEARLASHILVRLAAGADAEAERVALERAKALAEDARKPDADFAAIAKASSEDLGSKAGGGDLGWIERGMTNDAFEAALFAQAAGTVSDPVRSPEGWHIIQLREIRAEKGQSFAEARAEIEREYLDAERERLFSELSGKLVEAVYRDPSTLQAAADELKLEIRRTSPFGRLGGEGIAANPAVAAAAFDEQHLLDGSASDPISIGQNHVVVIRPVDHERAAPLPLEAVRERVLAQLSAERVREATKAEADAALARLKGGETLEAIATALSLEPTVTNDAGRAEAGIDRALLDTVFALARPAQDAVSQGLASLPDGRFALVELTAVKDGDASKLSAEDRNAVREQIAQGLSVGELRAYLDLLRARTEVKVVEDRM